ncbi:nucleotide sugar dehydrogenase [Paenibacillus xerothermodurans]|nr:nucleotide sugar dehydrogenase [Paenibacillus xerothermodurans]
MLKVCVVGLGYIGLPTAIIFAKHGVQVHGVDVNSTVVEALNNGELHLEEPGLKEALHEALTCGRLSFSTEPTLADAFIISVQTPALADHTADLSFVKAAAASIVPYLMRGSLVIVESTVPPKTVEEVVIPILLQSKLDIGNELYVAHSPERVIPGNILVEMVTNTRIVGGINDRSTEKAIELYRSFVRANIIGTDIRTAEMVKLMENTYRDINIAYANELARIAERIGFDIWEAISLANTHPRVHIQQPGPGVGGHCIAVDPWFIVSSAPEQARLIAMARTINAETPMHIAHRIEGIVGEQEKPVVTAFGLAYKGNIDDTRESPSLSVIKILKDKGFIINIYDPHVEGDFQNKFNCPYDAAFGSDCIVILTDHEVFKDMNYSKIKDQMRIPNLFDTRNILDAAAMRELGYRCFGFGPAWQIEKGERSRGL